MRDEPISDNKTIASLCTVTLTLRGRCETLDTRRLEPAAELRPSWLAPIPIAS
jgi:hypothetical protein